MFRSLFATLICLTVFVHPAEAARKLALVIGNNDYREVPKLDKAVGDAQAIGQALAGLGFDVTTALNADRRTLNTALSKLYALIEPGDTVLVQYSGHGVQIENENYLLPIDVPAIQDGNTELLKSESLRLLNLVDTLVQKGAGSSILIIDACRNNPFATGGKRAVGGTRGLANVATEKGTFIMYSAGAGQTALDRLSDKDGEATSVYTRVLLKRLTSPGVKLRDLAASIRDEVEVMGKSVGHEQRPAYYDDLPADFSLAPGAANPEQQAVYVPPKVVVDPKPAVRDIEDEARKAYQDVKDEKTPELFDIIAKHYPGTVYGEIAASRARQLRAAAQEKKKRVQNVIPDPPPKPVVGNLSWGVIVGSFERSEVSKARGRVKAARARGFDAQLIDTNNYSTLTPGLYAVVIAASSRNEAKRLADDVRNYFGDAYARQLQ